MSDSMEVATFAAVAFTLWVGHQVGDHWIQTDHQAVTKKEATRAGRAAALEHVATLTATKAAFLALVVGVLGLPVTVLGLVLGLGIDGVSHFWADYRRRLQILADKAGKARLWEMGEPIGGGAYQLDQVWHAAWTVPAALLIAAV